jgi:Prokaryotic RING finger family 1
MTDSQVATGDIAGRTCPYCFSPLKEGGSISTCPTCAAVHHSECWRENGGCAITSCAGGPPEPGEGRQEAPVSPEADGKQRATEPRRRRTGRIAAVAAVVLAAAGGVTAVALSSGASSSSGGEPAPVVDPGGPPDASPEPPPPDGEETIGWWVGEGYDDYGDAIDIDLDVTSVTGVDDGRLIDTWSTGSCAGTLGFSHMEGDTVVFDQVADTLDCSDSTVYLTPMPDGTLEFLETWSDELGDPHELSAILE